MFRKTLLAAMLASSLGSFAVPAISADYSDYGYRRAPPAPRHEVVPAPRHGAVWVPGYWERRDNGYRWVKGTWVRERRGHHYEPAHWVHRDGRWYFVQGAWRPVRGDRDGDGIPNRVDRDRDNDGVPNAHDRRPNDARRF